MKVKCFICGLSLIPIILAANTYDNFTARIEENSTVFSERSGRASLISFKPLGKNIALGLDLLLPFVKVPIKKTVDHLGNEPALVNVNTASLLTAGLIAGGGLFVGHLFRSLGLQSRAGENDDEEESEKSAEKRFDTEAENKFMNIFEPFKLVYRNSSGQKVVTSIPNLLTTVETSILEKDINLPACIQKSICSLVYNSGQNVMHGKASGVEKLIDGISSVSWLMPSMVEYKTLREAIDAGKMSSSVYCDVKYPMCKWSAPEEKLLHLLKSYVKFT